jgi:hypothetical protein
MAQSSSKLKRAAAALVLESERWKLELTKEGAIARFIHKPSGLLLLAGKDNEPAYELQTSGGTESNASADVSSEPISRGFRFRYKTPGRIVTAEIVHASGHGGIEFRARVENQSGGAPVIAVRYPILTAPPKLGESSEDDVILLPALDGGIVEDPVKNFGGQRRSSHYTYPGLASCQVVAFYDKTAGVYVAAHDPDGNGKLIGASRIAGGAFDLTISHLQPAQAAREIRIQYPVVIDSFIGDWYVAAEKYRAWSLRQSWSRERLADSRKVPNWIRKGAIVGEYDPTRESLESQRQWFEQVRGWFKVPFVPNNRGWEQHGTWAASEYLPPRPSAEAFRESARIVKETGGRGMIMLSGYRWTLQKNGYDSQKRFDKEVAPYAQCGKDGKPQIWTSSKKGDWHGSKWARLCRKPEFTKRLNLDVARYCVEAGYPVIHWDQEVGGAYQNSICYSARHGHPPGDGRWIETELEDLFKRFWKELAPLTPDFTLSMEEANECVMPYLAMAQQRPFACGREWPCSPPMTQAVPLLMYLHHEHLFGWAAYYPWRTTLEGMNYSLAKGFSAGLMPAIAKSFLQYRQQHPKQGEEYLKLFQSCMEGYRGFARDALMYGRMMRPLDLALPVMTFRFKDVPPQSFPAVLNSVWLTPGGRTVVVLINHTRDDHSFEVDLARAPGWSRGAQASWMESSSATPLQLLKVTVPALSLRAIAFPNGDLLRQQWRKERDSR